MNNHEEGLILQYVRKIQSLGVRAEGGEDVKAEVEAVVTKTVEHFRIVKSSPPKANLEAFRGRLKVYAEIAHPSQPAFKRTLEYASSITPTEI
jgi:hypothetical protein